MDQYPHCIFIAKVLKSSNVGGEQGHNYLLFDGKMDTDIKIVSSDGTNLKSLVSQFHNAKSCAFFYRSLDCNRSGEDDCTEELRGYIPIHEKTFNSAPYISDEEWGPTNPVITLGLYYSR
jgi:hypothetical protein